MPDPCTIQFQDPQQAEGAGVGTSGSAGQRGSFFPVTNLTATHPGSLRPARCLAPPIGWSRCPALEYESGLVDDPDVPLVVVKRGSEGATLVGHQGRVDVPAEPVPVIDVIGAGHALCAGMLSG